MLCCYKGNNNVYNLNLDVMPSTVTDYNNYINLLDNNLKENKIRGSFNINIKGQLLEKPISAVKNNDNIFINNTNNQIKDLNFFDNQNQTLLNSRF